MDKKFVSWTTSLSEILHYSSTDFFYWLNKLLSTSKAAYVETNPLNCKANQWTGVHLWQLQFDMTHWIKMGTQTS